jgi:hypothetical protein
MANDFLIIHVYIFYISSFSCKSVQVCIMVSAAFVFKVRFRAKVY